MNLKSELYRQCVRLYHIREMTERDMHGPLCGVST